MYTFRLVYILATSNGGGWNRVAEDAGEFVNRAAAKLYVDGNKDKFKEDVYILRKEVSHFYDQKIFDITNS